MLNALYLTNYVRLLSNILINALQHSMRHFLGDFKESSKYSDQAMSWTALWQDMVIFSFPKHPDQILQLTHHFSLGVKQAGYEANHSPPLQNLWSCTSSFFHSFINIILLHNVNTHILIVNVLGAIIVMLELDFANVHGRDVNLLQATCLVCYLSLFQDFQLCSSFYGRYSIKQSINFLYCVKLTPSLVLKEHQTFFVIEISLGAHNWLQIKHTTRRKLLLLHNLVKNQGSIYLPTVHIF